MAVRSQPRPLAGGIARWVPSREAQKIAREIAELATAADLAEWARDDDNQWRSSVEFFTAPGRAGMFGDDRPLTDADRAEATATVIVDVAARRRRDVLSELGRRHEQPRCARCDAALGEFVWPRHGGFYCDRHQREEDAEIAALLADQRLETRI